MRAILLLAATPLFLIGCSSMKQTASLENDDVYATAKDNPKPVYKEEPKPAPAATETLVAEPQKSTEPNSTSVETDEKGNTYIVNKYYDSDFDADDYYDYEYAVRIRRFYHPVSYYGYYDNYYTNSYWYTYNPHHWGISIYYGYPWWGPSYYTYNYCPSWYWYSGWGCDWSWGCGWGWGWSPGWYWGHHGGYWGGYGHGYNHGYWDGYWDGYNDGLANNYYYNSHDNSGYYYGPRPTTTHSNGAAINQHGANFEQAMAVDGNGFVPVKGNSYQSDPRPANAAMLQQGITTPGKGNTANPYTSTPRPMAPANTTGTDPKGNSTNNSNMNNLPIPSSTSGDGKGNTSGNPYQSAPRPMNPPAEQPKSNSGNTATPNSAPPRPSVQPAEQPQQNPYQSQPRPSAQPNEAPKDNSYQSTPRPRSSGGGYDQPRGSDQPRQHEAPKNQHQQSPPRSYDKPRNYDAPKSSPAPRSNPSPRSSGGSSSGGHSKPSGGNFNRR